jgi:hypothetical protein
LELTIKEINDIEKDVDELLSEMDNKEIKIEYIQKDINGLIVKMKSKERNNISFTEERDQFNAIINNLPTPDQDIRLISVGGGFSSISIIKYIAEKETIDNLMAVTFRIGKKQIIELNNLYESGFLKNAKFITSTSQERLDREYDYLETIGYFVKKNHWQIACYNNHAKVYLMKTEKQNYFVLETSSNLNENPKMEQFILSNDQMLYDFYYNLFDNLIKNY